MPVSVLEMFAAMGICSNIIPNTLGSSFDSCRKYSCTNCISFNALYTVHNGSYETHVPIICRHELYITR